MVSLLIPREPPDRRIWRHQTEPNSCTPCTVGMLLAERGIDLSLAELTRLCHFADLIRCDADTNALSCGYLAVQDASVYRHATLIHGLDLKEMMVSGSTAIAEALESLPGCGISVMTGLPVRILPYGDPAARGLHAVMIRSVHDRVCHLLDPDGGLPRDSACVFTPGKSSYDLPLDILVGSLAQRERVSLAWLAVPERNPDRLSREAILQDSLTIMESYDRDVMNAFDGLPDDGDYTGAFRDLAWMWIKPLTVDLRTPNQFQPDRADLVEHLGSFDLWIRGRLADQASIQRSSSLLRQELGEWVSNTRDSVLSALDPQSLR